MSKLGFVATDIVNGFTGIVMAKATWFSGAVVFAVESTNRDNDSRTPVSRWINSQRLRVNEDAVCLIAEIAPPETKIKMGSKVQDKITNFVGLVVAKNVSLFGEIDFVVESTVLQNGKPIPQQSFEVQRLELLEE